MQSDRYHLLHHNITTNLSCYDAEESAETGDLISAFIHSTLDLVVALKNARKSNINRIHGVKQSMDGCGVWTGVGWMCSVKESGWFIWRTVNTFGTIERASVWSLGVGFYSTLVLRTGSSLNNWWSRNTTYLVVVKKHHSENPLIYSLWIFSENSTLPQGHRISRLKFGVYHNVIWTICSL